MSEKQNRGIGDLSVYDTMATKELEEILRLDAEAPEEQESDIEKILYIMEVLAARKRNNGHPGKTALEAYESFKKNYMPESEQSNNVFKKTEKRNPKSPRWLRTLTATAAMVAILLLGAVTAEAFGMNLWKAIVQWTQETFHFGEWEKSDVDNNLQFDSLQDALEEGKISTAIVPTWIPVGYDLTAITVEQSPVQNKYRATYMSGESILKITVQEHLGEAPFYVEQSDGLIEEYEISGITYYLFSDIVRMKAKWIIDSYECSISGNLTIDELKTMLNSIGKG